MKKSQILASFAVVPLALMTACSASSESNNSSPEATMASIPPVTSASTSEANSTEANSSESASSSPSLNLNSRGNLEKATGEPAGIVAEDGTEVYTMKVTGIETGVQCTEPYASEPTNGQFIKLNVDVITGDASAFEEYLFGSDVYLTGYGWKYISAEGTTFNGDLASVATYGCIPDSETLPSSIGPGENVTGAIILDVPATDGTLVFKDSFLSNGWEWKIEG